MCGIKVAATIVFAALSSYHAAGDTSPEAEMVPIEGGSYSVGSEDGTASARPAHMIALEPFLIDATEVTNAQFATFRNTLEVTA
jgi:formylglycine-generating enzyme required for sulfatase activity